MKADKTDETLVVNNLEFWDTVQETDPRHTKEISFGGRKFNTIDAYYQIKTATSMWGMYGSTWGLTNIQYELIPTTPLMRVSTEFTYPDGNGSTVAFEITSAIKIANNKGVFDDDFAKKVETDLITKSLSRLGFNSDVFLGMFDDNKYTEELTEKYNPTYTENQKEYFNGLIESDKCFEMLVLSQSIDTRQFSDLYNSFAKGQKVKMKQVVDTMIKKGHEELDDFINRITQALDAEDPYYLTEVIEDIGDQGKIIVWNRLSDEQKHIAKEVLAVIPAQETVQTQVK